MLFFVFDVLIKLHYLFSSSGSSTSKGDSEDYTKRRSAGLIFVPFLCSLLHALRKNSVHYIHTWLLLLFIQKDVLDMTWFDLVCFIFFCFQMQRLPRWRFACSCV